MLHYTILVYQDPSEQSAQLGSLRSAGYGNRAPGPAERPTALGTRYGAAARVPSTAAQRHTQCEGTVEVLL